MGNSNVRYHVDNLEYLIKNMDKIDNERTILANMIVKMPNEAAKLIPQVSEKILSIGVSFDCLYAAIINNKSDIALLVIHKLTMNYYKNKRQFDLEWMISQAIYYKMDTVLLEFSKFVKMGKNCIYDFARNNLILTFNYNYSDSKLDTITALQCLKNGWNIKLDNINYQVDDVMKLFECAYKYGRSDISGALLLKHPDKFTQKYLSKFKLLEVNAENLLPPNYASLTWN